MTTPIRSAAAFKRIETHTLPSGLEADLRRPDAERIVMENAGKLPQPLVARIVAQLNGKPIKDAVEISAKDLPQWYTYIDMMVRAALVWPKIVTERAPDYDAGEIAQDDLDPLDRAWIYQWAMPQGVREQIAAAAAFRQQQTKPVPAGPDGEEVRQEAE